MICRVWLFILLLVLSACSDRALPKRIDGKAERIGQVRQASMTTAGVDVWHWNVAGDALHAGRTNTGLIEVMGASIVDNNEEFVSVNELCRSQYYALIDYLENEGWNQDTSFARFHAMRPTYGDFEGYCGCPVEGDPESEECDPTNAQYGMAIFYKYGFDTATAHVFETQDPAKDEIYAILCAPSDDLPHLRLCTTHLASATATARWAQVDEVFTILEDYYDHKSGDTVIVAGDFNEVPSSTHFDDWLFWDFNPSTNQNNTGFYRELDALDTSNCYGYGESTFNGGAAITHPCVVGTTTKKKIDHVFVRTCMINGSYYLDARAIPAACDTSDGGFNPAEADEACSDHRKVDGYVPLYVNL